MLRMVGKRLAFAIPSLIGVVIVTFLLTRALPGDPAAYFAGPAATPQAIAEIRKTLGLDKPLPEQFLRYVADLARGNLGASLTTGQPVAGEGVARDVGAADEQHHDDEHHRQRAPVTATVLGDDVVGGHPQTPRPAKRSVSQPRSSTGPWVPLARRYSS